MYPKPYSIYLKAGFIQGFYPKPYKTKLTTFGRPHCETDWASFASSCPEQLRGLLGLESRV